MTAITLSLSLPRSEPPAARRGALVQYAPRHLIGVPEKVPSAEQRYLTTCTQFRVRAAIPDINTISIKHDTMSSYLA